MPGAFMYFLWKRKMPILFATVLILSLAAAETVWGISHIWRGIWEKEVVIVIDAGHGGVDPGAVSVNGTAVEKDLNLAIALKLQSYLQEAGYSVMMTRVVDEDLAGEAGGSRKQADMKERIRLMEETEGNLMISIHQNSFPEEKYRGPQVFFQKHSEKAAALALLVQNEMNTFTAPENTRQAKANDSYYILKNASMPAILVECGFVSNETEAGQLMDETYQKKVAWGIYSGIEKYLQSDPL